MKRSIFFSSLAVLAILFTSCEQEEGQTPNEQYIPEATGDNPFPKKINKGTDGNGGGTSVTLPVGDVPDNFTKKAVLEENTGEWCGWCPYGARTMEEIIVANFGKVVGIGVHDGDPMEVSSYNSWQKNITNVQGFPNGSVDRADGTGRGSWSSQITTSLAENAKLGLAIDAKETGNILSLDVYIGYNESIIEDTKLTVVLIENDVPQSSPGAQSVYDDFTSTTLSPLPAGWMHTHVLRGLITTEVSGDDVDLTSTDKYTKVSFEDIDLSYFPKINDKANVHIAAFVHTNGSVRKVYNAQESELNETKAWD